MTFVPNDTKLLQEESLVNYMAAIGYEPLYNNKFGLCGFRQPDFDVIGKGRVGVNRAIRMHNHDAEDVFAVLQFTPYVEFNQYVKDNDNCSDLITLFAGTCKIVEKVKGVYSNKKGLIINNHQVKFMTARDRRFYRDIIGE